MQNKKSAFTLAEALIVVMLIGVVSMLTIPGMKIGSENKEHVTGVKKAYSTLSRASEMVERDIGPCALWEKARTSDDIMKAYQKQLNIARYCGGTDGCFTNKPIRYLNGGTDKNYNAEGGGQKLMTADGMTWGFDPLNEGGLAPDDAGTPGGDDNKIIAVFIVDTNGERGPNIWGKDVYRFVLTKENGVMPAGASSSATCTSSGTGLNCAAKVIAEGKIEYN